MKPFLWNYLDRVRLEAARAAKFKSANLLAKALVLGNSVYTQWIKGDTTPNGSTLMALCDLLDRSPAYLFGRDLDWIRSFTARTLRHELGELEGWIIEVLGKLSDKEKELLRARIETWIEVTTQNRQNENSDYVSHYDPETHARVDIDRNGAIRSVKTVAIDGFGRVRRKRTRPKQSAGESQGPTKDQSPRPTSRKSTR